MNENTDNVEYVETPQETTTKEYEIDEHVIVQDILTLEEIKEFTKENPLIDGYRFAHIAPSVITKDVLADIKYHKIKFGKSLQHWINKISETGVTLPTGYRDWETDRKSTRLNSSHSGESRMQSSA